MKNFTIAGLIIMSITVSSAAIAAQDQLVIEQMHKNHLALEQQKAAKRDHDLHAEAKPVHDTEEAETSTSRQDVSNK